MLLQGIGLPKDESRAAQFFESAAMQGDKGAQYELALSYRDGRGINADKVKAYSWLKIAAVGGGTEITKARDQVLSKLSIKELQEGEKLSSDITKKLMDKKKDRPQ
jgi:hypothetical protein